VVYSQPFVGCALSRMRKTMTKVCADPNVGGQQQHQYSIRYLVLKGISSAERRNVTGKGELSCEWLMSNCA
jgi:hypothetical protein